MMTTIQAGNDLELYEGNKCCGNEQLVRDRIEENANCCNLTTLSGQISVEQIRQGCRQKDKRGNDHVILGQEEYNQQWNRKNTDQGQCGRKIHPVILVQPTTWQRLKF
jgi:hypothetical protein